MFASSRLLRYMDSLLTLYCISTSHLDVWLLVEASSLSDHPPVISVYVVSENLSLSVLSRKQLACSRRSWPPLVLNSQLVAASWLSLNAYRRPSMSADATPMPDRRVVSGESALLSNIRSLTSVWMSFPVLLVFHIDTLWHFLPNTMPMSLVSRSHRVPSCRVSPEAMSHSPCHTFLASSLSTRLSAACSENCTSRSTFLGWLFSLTSTLFTLSAERFSLICAYLPLVRSMPSMVNSLMALPW